MCLREKSAYVGVLLRSSFAHVWNIYYLYTIICMNDVNIKAKTDLKKN